MVEGPFFVSGHVFCFAPEPSFVHNPHPRHAMICRLLTSLACSGVRGVVGKEVLRVLIIGSDKMVLTASVHGFSAVVKCSFCVGASHCLEEGICRRLTFASLPKC